MLFEKLKVHDSAAAVKIGDLAGDHRRAHKARSWSVTGHHLGIKIDAGEGRSNCLDRRLHYLRSEEMYAAISPASIRVSEKFGILG